MASNTLYRKVTALSSISRYQARVSSVKKNVVFRSQRLAHCTLGQGNPFIKISEEVREAIETQKPVVALETTIYTHGG